MRLTSATSNVPETRSCQPATRRPFSLTTSCTAAHQSRGRPRPACAVPQHVAAAPADAPRGPNSSSPTHHQSRRQALDLLLASTIALAASACPWHPPAAAAQPSRQSTGSAASTSGGPGAAAAPDPDLPFSPVRDLIEAAVGRKQVAPVEYGRLRLRCGFKRLIDGRVALRNKAGQWMMVRPDLKVPGLLLLRAPDGQIFIISTDTYKQIDLSDDISVAQFFSTGEWEALANPITFRDRDGVKKPLKLTDIQFRTVVTLFEDEELERLNRQAREQRLAHDSSGRDHAGGEGSAGPVWRSWPGRGR